MRLPQLAKALEKVPDGATVHIQAAALHHIDRACLELLEHASETAVQRNTRMLVEWDALRQRYWNTVPAR